MTMPHLTNCPHVGEGWCLDCVKTLHESRSPSFLMVPPTELAELRRDAEQTVADYEAGRRSFDVVANPVSYNLARAALAATAPKDQP